MRNALKWMVFSQLLALPAWAADRTSAVESCNEALEPTAGIGLSTDGERAVWIDVTAFAGLSRHVAVFADPPSEKAGDPPTEVTGDPPSEKDADPPTEYDADPPTEYTADPPSERGAQVLVDLAEDGHTLVVYLADPPDPDLGLADPPDPDKGEVDPPDPDRQIRIVVDQASIGSLTFVDSMGLPLILVGVGDPFVGDPFVGDPR
jgi:hypothetical protein